MKNLLKITAVYTGTFIGAGFASGQEILQYFVVHGKWGIAGAVLSSALFFAFCYCSMNNLNWLGEKSFMREVNRIPLSGYVYTAFMWMMFCTMITAFGETLTEVAATPKIYGVLLMTAMCWIILLFGGDGVVKLNAFITPIIILGILIVWVANVYSNTVPVMSRCGFTGDSVIYISYNTITLSSVTLSIKKFIKNRKTILVSSVMCGVVIMILIFCVWHILYSMPFSNSEIPILDAISEKYVWFYLPVMMAAMLTTAVSNGYGVMSACRTNDKFMLILLCGSAVLFSVMKFSFIVRFLYKFFGYIGLITLLNNFYIFEKNKKTKEKSRKLQKNRLFIR